MLKMLIDFKFMEVHNLITCACMAKYYVKYIFYIVNQIVNFSDFIY